MLIYALGPKILAKCPGWAAQMALALATVGLLTPTAHTAATINSKWFYFIIILLAGIIVSTAAFGRLGRIGRFFDLAPVRFYGRISYSFYLLHPLTLTMMWFMPDSLGGLVRLGIPAPLIVIGLFVLSTAVITPLAWLTYRYVEQPGIWLGRAVLQRRRSGREN
jgi:peptidoglycan/LPS O-acetylase OafA/YrhL